VTKEFKIVCTEEDNTEEIELALSAGKLASCLSDISEMLRKYTKYYDEATMPKTGRGMAEKLREKFGDIVASLPEGLI
jgi:hypothetical protein